MLKSFFAEITLMTRIYDAAYAGIISFLEFCDIFAYGNYFPGNLVSRYHWIFFLFPIAVNIMQIAMTDSGIQNFDLYLIIANGMSGKFIRFENTAFIEGSKTSCRYNIILCRCCDIQQ